MLMKVRDEMLFLTTHSSFVEFLWELKMTESTASKLIGIYKRFVVELGIAESHLLEAGAWTSLYKIKDLAKDKQSADFWIMQAEVLSPKDLDIEIKEAKTGVPQATCNHPDGFIEFRWCKNCNLKTRIYPDEN